MYNVCCHAVGVGRGYGYLVVGQKYVMQDVCIAMAMSVVIVGVGERSRQACVGYRFVI